MLQGDTCLLNALQETLLLKKNKLLLSFTDTRIDSLQNFIPVNSDTSWVHLLPLAIPT